MAATLSCAVAQACKPIYAWLRWRKPMLELLISSGGMPSSHAALVTGLAASIGRTEGINSSEFAIAIVLAGIVLYDAAGVRQAVSLHAQILNQFLSKQDQPSIKKPLQEMIGHTLAQVGLCWWNPGYILWAARCPLTQYLLASKEAI
jgi:uncharacterized protein